MKYAACYALTLAIIALLSSCSADWHLRKAIAKDPTILLEGKVIEYHTDTILVAIPELQVDTVHRWSVDTVTTYVDKVRIRTKVDTGRSLRLR
jgi:RPA family protein